MAGKILKIIICSIIFLIGLGGVNALDYNSSDDIGVNNQNLIEDNSEKKLSVNNITGVESDNLTSKVSKDSLSKNKFKPSIKQTVVYKKINLGKIKIPNKYKKFFKGHKPSKKNIKLMKNYHKFKKIEKKFEKQLKRVMIKAFLDNWKFNEKDIKYKIKYSKKFIMISVYVYAYRLVERVSYIY